MGIVGETVLERKLVQKRCRGSEDEGGKAQRLDGGSALYCVHQACITLGTAQVIGVGVNAVADLSPMTLPDHSLNDGCVVPPSTEVLSPKDASLHRCEQADGVSERLGVVSGSIGSGHRSTVEGAL